jgi:hypothetical protein
MAMVMVMGQVLHWTAAPPVDGPLCTQDGRAEGIRLPPRGSSKFNRILCDSVRHEK